MPTQADDRTVKGSSGHRVKWAAVASPAVVLAFGVPVWGQARTTPGERVEQGIGDVGPLSVSSRVAPVDLRHPLGFDAVYRLSEARVFGRSGDQGGLLARVSGAVWAVFPRSVYAPTPQGMVVPVPPGTVFHIGGIPEVIQAERPRSLLGADLGSAVLGRVDLGARRTAAAPAALDSHEQGPATIFASEAFRRARLEEILGVAWGVTGAGRSP